MYRNILLLCQYDPTNAAMVVDHINAIYAKSKHRVYVLQDFVRNGGVLPEDVFLDDFDVVVFHYSVSIALDSYVPPKTRAAISAFRGLKAAFIQDEYRFVNKTVSAIRDLGIKLLFTCVPEDGIEQVYPTNALPGVRRVNVLTGYNSEWLSLYPPLPISERKVDVGYRGRVYPAWHGRSGREKWVIADDFSQHSLVRESGLRLDVSYDESSRLYGHAWTDFIRNCKAMLGVESGCSVFDFDGSISSAVETYTSLLGVDVRDDAQYQKLKDKFFPDLEDVIPLNQISPRCLEAINLKTLLVLYEGEYSGILEPWRHYVPLKKDLSNMQQVMSVLSDDEKIAEIVARAYGEVACREELSYRSFIKKFDLLIDEGCADREEKSAVDFYSRHRFYYVENPHSYRPPSAGGMGRRVIKGIWKRMPIHMRLRIKNLVR